MNNKPITGKLIIC